MMLVADSKLDVRFSYGYLISRNAHRDTKNKIAIYNTIPTTIYTI